MRLGAAKGKKRAFLVADDCHPQTLGVVRTRAESIGVAVHVGPAAQLDPAAHDACGVLLQYPATDGRIADPRPVIERAHAAKALAVVAADPLALVLLTPPGELGADIAVGSMQRFGVPLGYGGPHAGYLSAREELARKLPGRLVGVSRDAHGQRLPAGDPDARAAHPARQGDQQHLHRPGAARDHGRLLRRLSRPRGPAPHRAPRARLHPGAGRGPAPHGPRAARRALLRHAARAAARQVGQAGDRRRAPARLQPARLRRRQRSA